MKITKEITEFYLGIFHQQGEKALVVFCNCDLPCTVFLEQYKKFPPLESLSEKEKSELKKYVINLFPGKPVEFLVKASKVIYTIGSLI